MSRPLRIEFPGALYHVMARGNARQPIVQDDRDRHAFLANLARVSAHFDWRLWSYCLMDNHYHVMIETLQPTLARGMRELNGVYAQMFNRRHHRVGHVLQGRYRAILVDRDNYLLELSRYIVLNPVRAQLCTTAGDWKWSSYRATMGAAPAINRLAVDALLEHFAPHRGEARRAFASFVADGTGVEAPPQHRRMYVGGDNFLERIAEHAASPSTEVPREQRSFQSIERFVRDIGDRDEAIRAAYQRGRYTMKEIGAHFGLHYTTASRIARGAKRRDQPRSRPSQARI